MPRSIYASQSKRGPRRQSAEARRRISAAAKARWARIKGESGPTLVGDVTGAAQRKPTLVPEARVSGTRSSFLMDARRLSFFIPANEECTLSIRQDGRGLTIDFEKEAD
jgi:hypothetical protein